MSEEVLTPPPLPPPLPPVLPDKILRPEQALRRLFLTLFLRGRGARGLNKQSAPKSVGQKLVLSLLVYGLFGCVALTFMHQPVFALAVYLHALTFVFLGMFIASSAGEMLFNKEEADILLHRPITPRAMLWAKIRVLVEVSLWLAAALNLAGLLVGLTTGGGWLFFLIHIGSLVLEAVFCASCVVLLYQLCLRWFGRERLEGLMTMSQVVVSIALVLSGQILPRIMFRAGAVLKLNEPTWWTLLLPPAWFAGLDDAVAGTSSGMSWLMAALALLVTALVMWLAFGHLARDYEIGLQRLNETSGTRRQKPSQRRWLDRLVELPPLTWWLRDPVGRASFLLTIAYLTRDRETKLRVYPGIAPVVILPFIVLWQNHQGSSPGEINFIVPFMGIYLGMVPMASLQLLRYSQQWPAADVFQMAPMLGPGAICHGARRAVLLLLVAPVLVIVLLITWLMSADFGALLVLLPGLTMLPVFSLIPAFQGKGLPLCQPIDSAKAASRAPILYLTTGVGAALALLTTLAWKYHWFWTFEIGLVLVSLLIYRLIRRAISKQPWPPAE
jgi:hypothetical protein